MTFLVDRSRIQAYFTCPRYFYWGYLHDEIGVTGAKTSIPLVVGGAVHKGLEHLLRGDDVNTAVHLALSEFSQRCSVGGLSLETREDASFVYREQSALVEALVRVWARRRLPSFLEEFEILGVEEEVPLQLDDDIILMTRSDGRLRKRSNGQIYVLSFKTAKRYDSRLASDGNHDVQGLSELVAIERQHGETVTGIQMEYLIKGARLEYPEGSGIYVQNSPLIHPWSKPGPPPGGLDMFAHSWKWSDPDGSGHTLGKGWRKVNIWDRMPISEWIGLLDSGKIQPEAGDPLSSVLVSPLPYMRRQGEVDDWVEQTTALAQRIKLAAQSGKFYQEDELRRYLNVYFPQNRKACNWPSRCVMQDICFGPCGANPIESGLYKKREPHHDLEIERYES